MSVDVKNGQKTGYFLDQKENRSAARRYCKDARVLDCFCNSGGFSLNAATVAKEVTALDISEFALANVRENAALNQFTNIRTQCADVFEALRAYKAEGKKFDCIVLDPPAFCKSAAEVRDACRGYKDINLLAMKLVERGRIPHYVLVFALYDAAPLRKYACGRCRGERAQGKNAGSQDTGARPPLSFMRGGDHVSQIFRIADPVIKKRLCGAQSFLFGKRVKSRAFVVVEQ